MTSSITLGFLEFGFLSCFALVAALAVSVRMHWSNRAELATATGMIAHALIGLPILFLGWTNLLYRSVLALTCAGLFTVTLGATCIGRPWREQLADVKTSAWSLARLPFDGLAHAWREKSLTFAGLLVSLFSIVYTAWLSYLAPSSSWDGIWYHESIVSFALQNHGFRLVEVPGALTYVNSFPRLCESMNLWFVTFSDRRLVEAVNSAMSPMIVLSFYAMARRFTGKLAAMGWASAFFLIPGIIMQLRSTYIDTHIAGIFLPAMLFATRPNLRLRDVTLAFLCIAMLGGTKYHALAWVPYLTLTVVVRVLANDFRSRPLASIASLFGGALAIFAVGAPPLLRNWITVNNPVWPLAIDIPQLNLHLPGVQHAGDLARPWSQVLRDNFAPYVPGHDFADTQVNQFGLGFFWVVLPIAAIGLPAAIFMAVKGRLAGRVRNGEAENLLLIAIPALLTLPVSPAAWAVRYNVHVAAAIMLVAVWAGGQPRFRLLDEGASATTIVTALMLLWWADPGWSVTFAQARALSDMTPEVRATFGWAWHTVPSAVAAARERELGPNDVVVFTDSYTFPSVLWNERYSNQVVYLPFRSPEDFLGALDKVRAKWATALQGSGEFNTLHSRPNEWEEVGLMSITNSWTAFRRRAP